MARIDIHSHLLPGIDDGCPTLEESLQCARLMVAAGYSHAFCTPHVGPNMPGNDVVSISARAAEFQAKLREAQIPLQVLPGGEINISFPETLALPEAEIVTLAMNRRYVLTDFWADHWPEYVEPVVRRFQAMGLKVILAHPERLGLVQRDPTIVERFLEMDLLLQGNLKCLSDPLGSGTRTTIERLLLEERYFALASDTHRLDTLPPRLDGLGRAIELVGREMVDELTIHNPMRIVPKSPFD